MRLRSGIATVLLTTALAGCSGGGPSAEQAGEALATGLAKLDLTGIRMSADHAQAELERITADLTGEDGAGRPEVSLADVAEDGDTATATLAWRWNLDGHDWAYRTTAELTRVEDAWSARWSPTLVEPSLAAGEVLEASSEQATRGDILGRDGRPIVTLRPVVRFGLDKMRVPNGREAAAARRLAEVLDIDAAPYVKAVRAAGDDAFVEAIVLREPDAGRADGRLEEIPGAAAIADELPLAPTREFAASLLGTVGQATADVIEESDGAVSAGDEVGLSGLQLRYDEQLRGTPGLVVAATGEKGEARELFHVEPDAGQALRTSLDLATQELAEELLAGTGPASAIVAIQPSTGDILAAASGPGSSGYNTATFGQYAPGSTFKVVSSLALLRGGLTPDSRVPCTPTVVVDGKTFKNYDDYPSSALGDVSLRTAIAQSCNTAVIASRGRVGRGALAEAAAALGLGVDHDLGFPAYFGQVPPATTETEAAADLIGQGKVLASPMAMATVAASVAAGRAVLPRLLPDHDVSGTKPERPLTRREAEALRGLMRAVVTEGSGRFLLDVAGQPVLAKTGTAEFGDASRTHAWMIAAQGDLAVAVFVEVGESGSRTAGPLLEEFLRSR